MKLSFGLNTITGRLLLILIFLFLFIFIMVYFVIEYTGEPEIQKISEKIVIESGNEVVDVFVADLSKVDGLVSATASISGSLPKEPELFASSVGPIFKNTDKNIVSAGVWFDPNMFAKDVDRQSFVWHRDHSGKMQQTQYYNQVEKVKEPYHRDLWYVPTTYAEHKNCVWSAAYVDELVNKPVMTCAKAVYNDKNMQFEGVASFNVLLDERNKFLEKMQEKTGGYIFLVDMHNRFLTFPNLDMVTHREGDKAGQRLTVSELAERDASFAPIADFLVDMNEQLITTAKKTDEGKFNIATSSLQFTTNLSDITKQEAQTLSAMLLEQQHQSSVDMTNYFKQKIPLDRDVLLDVSSAAFVFRLPSTNWKLVIVKPNSELVAVAKKLSKQLQFYMLLGVLPVLLIIAFLLRQFYANPLRRVSTALSNLSGLVDKKKYLELSQYKLYPNSYDEINTIGDSMNQFIDKVVENEGALAEVNVYLEKKVEERTEKLEAAMIDLKQSQVQLVRSEKMATLGQMVAGVAHEVNTPLGYVRSNVEFVKDNIGRFEELYDHTTNLLDSLQDSSASNEDKKDAFEDTLACCQDIQEDETLTEMKDLVQDSLYGVDQISDLVVNMRDFARLDESKVKDIDLNDCVTSSLTIARNNIKRLNVVTKLADLPNISCNPSQINQVLLNMINNAAQAMPDDGSGELTIKSYVENEKIVLSVADNGTGIEQEVIEQMFEPFFTTKKAGEGTGLGLAISMQIMEQHNATIEVDSAIGVGTTFYLLFPIVNNTENKPKKVQFLTDDAMKHNT